MLPSLDRSCREVFAAHYQGAVRLQDPLLDVRDAVDFLDTKRTTMKLTSIEGKLGHMPQEDFADAVSPVLLTAFAGGDVSVKGTKKFRKRDFEDEGYYEGESGNFVD